MVLDLGAGPIDQHSPAKENNNVNNRNYGNLVKNRKI